MTLMNLYFWSIFSNRFSPGTPLWNIKLIHLAGNRTAVVLKIHHIIGDGVSFMSLLEEFCDKGWSVRSFIFLSIYF